MHSELPLFLGDGEFSDSSTAVTADCLGSIHASRHAVERGGGVLGEGVIPPSGFDRAQAQLASDLKNVSIGT